MPAVMSATVLTRSAGAALGGRRLRILTAISATGAPMDKAFTQQLNVQVISVGTGKTVMCPPLERWERWDDPEGLEDKQLVCGPRGCVPIDVLLSDESGAYGWMDSALSLHHRKVFGSTCCYCGEQAGENGEPCKYDGCNCSWALAESVWINQMDTDSAKKLFREAVENEPNNADLQAAFAIFCWLGLQDIPRARVHYARATELDPRNLNVAASRAYFEMTVA